jgi:hypothetical protein
MSILLDTEIQFDSFYWKKFHSSIPIEFKSNVNLMLL